MKIGEWIQIILLMLKITDKVDWPWWIILLPIEFGVLASIILWFCYYRKDRKLLRRR